MSGRGLAGAGATAAGGRPYNEDSFVAEAPVYVVADGMGGHVGGEAASRAAVAAFRPLVGDAPVTPDQVVEAVHQARLGVDEVSRRLRGDSGTTLTGAVAVTHGGEAWWMVINVGDSRVYLLDGGTITQVTRDHSRVQELIDAGWITEAQARVHPERNIVTRAIGDDLPGQDAWLVPLAPGRRLVIASDGLMKELDDAAIAAVVAAHSSPAAAAQALVEAALVDGAEDNVTVVVAEADAVTPDDADADPWPRWDAPGA